jgi:hypothetical protein
LNLTYSPAHWALSGWLEDWELSYHLDTRMDEQDMRRHREQLAELWALMAVLRDWIKPQNRSGLEGDLEKAWLPIQDKELPVAVDQLINRALENHPSAAAR